MLESELFIYQAYLASLGLGLIAGFIYAMIFRLWSFKGTE